MAAFVELLIPGRLGISGIKVALQDLSAIVGRLIVSAKRMGLLFRIYFIGMLVTCQGKGNLRGR